MAGMIVTNGQMVVTSFQGNGDFASYCSRNSFSSSGLYLSLKPSLGIDLKVQNRRFKRGLVSRALLKGGSGGQSVDGLILEKEFEFKPSFEEYLMVMESVRTVRDKKQDNGSEKKKSLADEDEVDVKLRVSEGNLEKEKKLRVVQKDGSLKSRDGFKKQEHKRKKIAEVKGRIDSKGRSSVGKENGKPGNGMADRKWSQQRTHMVEEEEEDVDEYSMDIRKEEEHKARSSEMLGKKGANDRRRNYRLMSEVAERERIDVGSNKLNRGPERKHVQDNKVIGKDDIVRKHGRLSRRTEAFIERVEDKSLNVERAAFRNFDKINDVMDGRRRPRVEMDERIEKLAKSLNGADVDMPEWMFSKMMRSARIIFTDHSFSRLIQILGKLGNWRRVLQVIEWLQIRERFKSHKLRYIYTTALCVLGKARRPVEALNVFDAMQQEMSSYPDLVAYHSIAITLGQAGHMKELFDVIDTMRSPPKKKFKPGALGKWDPCLEPDIIVYNAVLNACVQRKQWEGAFWVLQQLKEKGLQPSVTTYGLVMEVMFACGKYNLVHDFFRKVQKSSIPNALIYKVLVNTLWKEGKLDEAVLAVEDMEKRGIVGSAALYYDFARCLCSAGRRKDALMQIEKICKVANKPLVVTYTGLIQVCLDSGKIKDGAYIFNHMKDFCSPNLVTCNIMLKGYLKHGMFEEGKQLFEKMIEDGSHIKSKDDHKVLVAPDIYTFNTLLDTCISEKQWDDFEYAYKQMLHHGHHFNSKRHLQMILNASGAGKAELLDLTWNYLVESDRSPPPALVKERFCMKLEKEDYACALSCICNQNLPGLPEFSKKAWSKLLEENSARFHKGTLVRLIHEIGNIIARTDETNPLLDNLLASCKELCRTSAVANVEPTETFATLQAMPALEL